ncbi:MAG: hypothetical protein KC413_16845 [Anaerolineales bacterium]|nr:hypothetical protein [Anaerolineales bacterium]
MIDLLLRNVLIEGEPTLVDVAVDEGVIVDRGLYMNFAARQEIDGNGRFLTPSFIESHLHLDIALMNDW